MELHYLRFFPLVIWALGMIFVNCLNEHWRKIDGREETLKEEGEAGSKIWVWGCIVFFIIGLIT